LGERRLCTAEVRGSNPLGSTPKTVRAGGNLRAWMRASYSDSSRGANEACLRRLKEIRIIRKLESSIA
jgi:hypothetical protein